MRKQLWMAGMLAVAGGVVVAAEPSVEAGVRCAQVKDSLERLVCYDRVFSGAQVPVAAPAPRAVAPAPAAPVAAPAAPVAAPAAVASTPPPAPREFGDDQVKRSEKQRQAESGPTSLTAQVSGLREYRPRTYLITLDNGQIWRQMDMDSLFQVAEGDTVQIEKGRLGGYRMARTSNGRSGWVRVNREK